MTLIVGIAAVFFVLLLLPFIVAMLSVRKSGEASLYVKSDNVRDPRYFSHSFRALVEKGIDRQNRTIQMSKLEPFVYADGIADNPCDIIVVAETPFRPAGIHSFLKEIYAESSAVIPAGTTLRAIACLKNLELFENCEVVRWADADEQLTVKEGCRLGMSVTSASRLLIAPGCTFRRLYAPEIAIGRERTGTPRLPDDVTVSGERLIDPEDVRPHETVEKTIVTEYSLEIGEGAVVMGSVKSNGHICIHQNARVNGNVVADGAIILEAGVRVLGNVFSQDSILVGPGAAIGVSPKIKSLIARKSITLSEHVRIFGYVGCEVDSLTISKEQFQAEISQKQWSSKTRAMQAEIAEEKADDLATAAAAEKTPAAVKAAGEVAKTIGKAGEEEPFG